MSRIQTQTILQRFPADSLRPVHARLDALQQSFSDHLVDAPAIASMMFAGGIGKILLHGISPISARPFGRFFAQTLSVGGESAAFAWAQRRLHPEFSETPFFKDCQTHFIQFSLLRFVGISAAHSNPLMRFGLESSGMVLGQRLAQSSGFENEDGKSLSESWLEASVFALQNRFSTAALHTLGANRGHLIERQWELRRQSRIVNVSKPFSSSVAQMSAGDWRAERKARQQALMEAEDPAAYFRMVEGVLDVVHSEADLATWVRIRTEIEARRAEHSIPPSRASLPIGVSIFIRDEAGHVLTTYDRRSVSRRPRIPSESVEVDDTSIEAAMLRGIREELGCSARLVGRVARQSVQFFIGDMAQAQRHYYLLEAELTSPIRLPAGGEIEAVEYAAADRHFHFSAEGLYAPLDSALNDLWRGYAREYPRRR